MDLSDEAADAAATLECVLCGGPMVILGRLGALTHFRCRNCGANHSARWIEEDEETDG